MLHVTISMLTTDYIEEVDIVTVTSPTGFQTAGMKPRVWHFGSHNLFLFFFCQITNAHTNQIMIIWQVQSSASYKPIGTIILFEKKKRKEEEHCNSSGDASGSAKFHGKLFNRF